MTTSFCSLGWRCGLGAADAGAAEGVSTFALLLLPADGFFALLVLADFFAEGVGFFLRGVGLPFFAMIYINSSRFLFRYLLTAQ